MSEIEKFKKTYANEKTLKETLEEIEMKDISSIKKLELKQQAMEQDKENRRMSIFKSDTDSDTDSDMFDGLLGDTYMDELIEEWGRGYRYRD